MAFQDAALTPTACANSSPAQRGEDKCTDTEPAPIDTEQAPISKKAAKKAEKAAAKGAKRAAKAEEQQAAANVLNRCAENVEHDFFGFLHGTHLKSSTPRNWCSVSDINESKAGSDVWVRCRIQESRCKGALGFFQLRDRLSTIQGVLDAKAEGLGRDAVKWAGGLPLESIVDVYATVIKPDVEITSTTQTVELHIKKVFCISKAAQELPFQLKDANRPDPATGGGSEESANDVGVITVGQETRLDNRILDLRTFANHAIFKLQSMVSRLFREYLYSQGFTEIHTPKLIGGAAESGASVFTLSYFGSKACLAQSPQLHKQMAICADMDRVFEIGPVFRAENSNTYRHLCEFTGLDFEMAFKESYEEVLDVLDATFKYIFEGLNTHCEKDISRVYAQYPATPFRWIKQTPRLTFEEGIQLLRDAGYNGIPDDISEFDLSTELEKALGKIVREKYNTDFYILLRYPLKVRPFYTMPCPDNPRFSNSYDVFMRGEEIVSGAQRIHDPELLTERAKAWGIPIPSIQSYIDSFKLGSYPHGGCGIGLERVVMLFLGLNNIRKTSMFPRDPKRLAP